MAKRHLSIAEEIQRYAQVEVAPAGCQSLSVTDDLELTETLNLEIDEEAQPVSLEAGGFADSEESGLKLNLVG